MLSNGVESQPQDLSSQFLTAATSSRVSFGGDVHVLCWGWGFFFVVASLGLSIAIMYSE
jgi:hypothetical protein